MRRTRAAFAAAAFLGLLVLTPLAGVASEGDGKPPAPAPAPDPKPQPPPPPDNPGCGNPGTGCPK